MILTVLLVANDKTATAAYTNLFNKKEYAILTALSGRQALKEAKSHNLDAIVVDATSPRLNCKNLCRKLKNASFAPLVLITQPNAKIDGAINAAGLVPKPTVAKRLVARVKAILRRTAATASGARPIEVGPLRIDGRRREAVVGERRLDLRTREFDLLAALARDAGVVLTRDALLEDVWGTDFPGETRTVDVHVAELRKKLGDDGPPIETVRGVGYRLVPPGRAPLPREA